MEAKTKITGKNIVICLDGTGNQFRDHNTNVVTLFRVLQRNPRDQVAYYDPGVGTLADPDLKTPLVKRVDKLLGLAFGRGLLKNVSQAYSYLMEQYEQGDRIFLFGFSRGAYTARVLAGLVHACGLLEKGCQNLIPYAMKLYKAGEKLDFQILGKFKSTYGRNVDVHFMGLWDTVSTFGWVYDPIILPFTTNNKNVLTVRHALAIDERRVFFRPKHWGTKEKTHLKEVWFAGVHSDVGGGYPESESGLAKIGLQWMVQEARNFHLLIDDNLYERYVLGTRDKKYVGPNHQGPQHASLKGLWRIVEYLPQRVWDPELERRRLQLFPRPARPRRIPSGATLHHTVLKRMEKGDYQPLNLPSADECRRKFQIEGLRD